MSSPLDILITLEAARALGIDAKVAEDSVFREQLRPEIKYIWENYPTATPPAGPPGYRVRVPEGQRWIIDWLVCRGIAKEGEKGGDTMTFALSTNISRVIGVERLPNGEFKNEDVRCTYAVQPLTTQSNQVLGDSEEYKGWRPFIGVNNAPPDSGGDYFSFAGPLILYPGTILYIQAMDIGSNTWEVSDQLSIRGRYLAMPEHLLNFSLAKVEQFLNPPLGTKSPQPGDWAVDPAGTFAK